MSDYRAVAGITGALQQLLQGPVGLAVPGTTVRTGPPTNGQLAGAPGLVNVFLYQVTPNAHRRNTDLPTRRSDGSLIQRPHAALDLSYLISFYGEELKMVPQLLLGATVAALHAQPTLTAEDVPRELNGRSFADSGLLQEAPLAQFRPVPLSHEELSRIWSVFFQVPYALSVAYTCSMVLVEADLTPEPALPVRELRLFPSGAGAPSIDRVEPQVVEPGAASQVAVHGEGLTDAGIEIEVGGLAAATEAGEGSLSVRLPPELSPGLHAIHAVRPRSSNGAQAVGARSEPATVVLLPLIDGKVTAAEADGQHSVRLRSLSPIADRQRLAVLLFESPVPEDREPRNYRLRCRLREGDGHEIQSQPAALAAGVYLVQLEVDRVASRLRTEEDPDRPGSVSFTGPKVEIE